MTAMLASVTGPEEAKIVIAGGVDIVDLKQNIDQQIDPLSRRKLSLVTVTLQVLLAAAQARTVETDLELRQEICHPPVVVLVELAVPLDVGGKRVHEIGARL